jgi:hypothetical protein
MHDDACRHKDAQKKKTNNYLIGEFSGSLHRSLAGSLGSPYVSYILSINKDNVPPIRVYVSLNKKLRQTHQNKKETL